MKTMTVRTKNQTKEDFCLPELQVRLLNIEFPTDEAFHRFLVNSKAKPQKGKVSFKLGCEEHCCRSWRSQWWQPVNCKYKSRTLVSLPCNFKSRSEPVLEPKFTSYPNYLDSSPCSNTS